MIVVNVQGVTLEYLGSKITEVRMEKKVICDGRKRGRCLYHVTPANLNSTSVVAINSAAPLVPEEESRAAIN